MAPSRGISASASDTLKSNDHDHDHVAVDQQSKSALVNARRNFNYLINPSTAAGQPARFRTRAFLRTVRYVSTFIFWRLVRWAKYAAVGGLVAAVSATAVGGFVSGIGWIAAPPTIGASILMYGVWGVGKFAARRLHTRWKKTGGDVGQAQREQREDSGVKADGRFGTEMGPQAVPW